MKLNERSHRSRYAPLVPEAIVSPEWLLRHLLERDLRIADVRWYLTELDLGIEQYQASHLPGAVFLDLEKDLASETGPGRHPLPDPRRFGDRLGELGIGNDHHVVVYDDSPGGVAARLWWLLRHFGHEEVSVLDGGFRLWTGLGYPTTSGGPEHAPTTFEVVPATGDTVDRSELEQSLGQIVLLDARAGERYRGEVEPIDPAAGHIPTALSAPTSDNIGDNGRWLPAEDLRRHYQGLGVSADTDVVVYCGSGVTACHDLLALHRASLGSSRLYPGSWSDWSGSGGRVATGGEPGELH